MAKRGDEFVVGAPLEADSVWGMDLGNGMTGRHLFPATALSAVCLLKEYQETMDKRGIIYRLVEVPLAEVEAQAERECKARKEKR